MRLELKLRDCCLKCCKVATSELLLILIWLFDVSVQTRRTLMSQLTVSCCQLILLQSCLRLRRHITYSLATLRLSVIRTAPLVSSRMLSLLLLQLRTVSALSHQLHVFRISYPFELCRTAFSSMLRYCFPADNSKLFIQCFSYWRLLQCVI